MELVNARATERIRAHLGVREPRALVRAMLAEVLPLGPERMAEMRVNLALIVESPAYPRLAELALIAQPEIGGLCREACRHLQATGLLHADRDVPAEGARLHALLDGIAMHLVVVGAPAGDDPMSVVDRHLDELAGPPAGPGAA